MQTETALWFECTFGSKSHLNLAGKIILSPIILILGGTYIALDFLFTKRTNENDNETFIKTKSQPDAHELWATAQLMPGEGIEDGVRRIEELLERYTE